MRLEKVIIQMKHVCVEQAAEARRHRGFARAAVAVDGKEHALPRLQQGVDTRDDLLIGLVGKNRLW